MNTHNHRLQTCSKHSKYPTILIVRQAKYICEDCAIFDSAIRHEHLLDKQSIPQELNSISLKCSQLMAQEKQLVETGLSNIKVLIRSIEHFQASVVNKINNQFMEVKSRLSENFMRIANILSQHSKLNGGAKLEEVIKQVASEQKIKKYHLCERDLNEYEEQMTQQMKSLFQVFDSMKQQVEQEINVRVDILSAFQSVFIIGHQMTNNKTKPQVNTDEDLLDFSEFSLPVIQQSPPKTNPIELPFLDRPYFPCKQTIDCLKREAVGRRKTAACLEDSICSADTLSQSVSTKDLVFNVSEISHQQTSPFLLSDRSISCTSTVSKYQQTYQFINMPKQPSKKSVIQINCQQQLAKKLLAIPPTVKIIHLANLSISVTQFSQVLKQKISRSFITSLEILNCPKLNQKILIEIKNHRCKGLKKVEIRECKEFNWSDKKVKQVVKKLECEGVKVVF